MHLRIVLSVPLIEMIDCQGKELKCQTNAPEPLQKVIIKFCDVAGNVWVDLKLYSRSNCVRCFEVVHTSHQNTVLQSG